MPVRSTSRDTTTSSDEPRGTAASGEVPRAGRTAASGEVPRANGINESDDGEVRIVRQADSWLETSWGSVYCTHHTKGSAEDTDIRDIVQGASELIAQHGQISLLVITGEARPPSALARKELANFIKEHQQQVRGIGIWIQARGIFAAASRSVATGIFLLNSPAVSVKFLKNRSDAANWLSKHSGEPVGSASAALDSMLLGDGEDQ